MLLLKTVELLGLVARSMMTSVPKTDQVNFKTACSLSHRAMNPFRHRQTCINKLSYDSELLQDSLCDTDLLLSCRSVQCYSTCVIGQPLSPTIPLRCCADSILDQPLTQTVEPSYTLVRLYSPNAPGEENYQSNTICK